MKKVRMPKKNEKCANDHYFVHENGELTDHVAFDKKGEPFCETCDDVDKVLRLSELPKGKNGKPEGVCPQGHKATKTNRQMVADVEGGKVVGIHFVCKDCDKKIKKAEPRRIVTPTGKEIRSRGGRYDLSAATANVLDDGSFKLQAIHKPTGEVRDVTTSLPGRSEESYTSRSRNLGRLYNQSLDLPSIIDATNNMPNHGIEHGDTVGIDHVVPLRGGGFHHNLNAVLKPQESNRSLQDKMPTVQDIEGMGSSFAHLVPFVRALNPTGSTSFYAKQAPVSTGLPIKEYKQSDLGIPGDAGAETFTKGKFTHYGIPGFNQRKNQEFTNGTRNEAVNNWLGAVTEQYGQIPNFNYESEPVFNIQQRKDGKGQIEFLNPKIRNHLVTGMEKEYDQAGIDPEVKGLFRQQARLMLSTRSTLKKASHIRFLTRS